MIQLDLTMCLQLLHPLVSIQRQENLKLQVLLDISVRFFTLKLLTNTIPQHQKQQASKVDLFQ